MPLTANGQAAAGGNKTITIHVDRDFDYSLKFFDSTPTTNYPPAKIEIVPDAAVKIQDIKETKSTYYAGHELYWKFGCNYKTGWGIDMFASVQPTPIGVTVLLGWKLTKHASVTASMEVATAQYTLTMGRGDWISGSTGWDGPVRTTICNAGAFAPGLTMECKLSQKDYADPAVHEDVMKKTYWKLDSVIVLSAQSAYGNGAEKAIDLNNEKIEVVKRDDVRWYPGIKITCDSTQQDVPRQGLKDMIKNAFSVGIKINLNAGRAAEQLGKAGLQEVLKSSTALRTFLSAVANFLMGAGYQWFVAGQLDQLTAQIGSSSFEEAAIQRGVSEEQLRTEIFQTQVAAGDFLRTQTLLAQANTVLSSAVEEERRTRQIAESNPTDAAAQAAYASATAVRTNAFNERDSRNVEHQVATSVLNDAKTRVKDKVSRYEANNVKLQGSISANTTGIGLEASISKSFDSPKFRFIIPVLMAPGYWMIKFGFSASASASYKLFPSDEEVKLNPGMQPGAWELILPAVGGPKKRTWTTGFESEKSGFDLGVSLGAEAGITVGIASIGAGAEGKVTFTIKFAEMNKVTVGGSFTVYVTCSFGFWTFWTITLRADAVKIVPPTGVVDMNNLMAGMQSGGTGWQIFIFGKDINAL